MRLSKIKLAGFKSFVDPTHVFFPTNLSAVVGPNGCGKSNIIDAVRWVMGESSAKNLRGGQLTDVIFNGAAARKPVGQASVELHFDNALGRLGGEFSKFSEIAIRRVVTREGVSTYYLNGTRCRKKDITDLFLGTGMGPRSYAIIEQGTISKLVEAKPDELRVFLEEAAGISKYKERRRETENRIRHTRENLERLQDLRLELAKQTRHLQRQSNAAQKYKTLKQSVARYQAELYALNWQQLSKDWSVNEQAIRAANTDLTELMSELRHCEACIEKDRAALSEVTKKLENAQKAFYQTNEQIVRLEQSLKHHDARHTQLQADKLDAETSLATAQSQLEIDNAQLIHLRPQIKQAEVRYQQACETAQLKHEMYQAAEIDMTAWRTELDTAQQAIMQPSKIAESAKTTIQHLEDSIHRNHQKEAKLIQEQATLGTNDLESALMALRAKQEMAEATYEAAQLNVSQIVQKISDGRQKLQHLMQAQKAQQKALQHAESKQASLTAVQQVALGQQVESVNAWLNEHALTDKMRLAHFIQVSDAWAHAFETVLADWLEGVCLTSPDTTEAFAKAMTSLTSGQLTLLQPLDTSLTVCPLESHKTFQLLSTKINWVDPSIARNLQACLKGVYFTETLESALAGLPQLQMDESVITQAGIWLGPGWVRIKKGSSDSDMGVLGRAKALEDLEKNIQSQSSALSILEASIEDAQIILEDLTQQQDSLLQTQQATQQDLSELKGQVRLKQNQIEHIQGRQSKVTSELEDLQKVCADKAQTIEQARSTLSEALDSMATYQDKLERLQQTKDDWTNTLQTLRREWNTAKESEHSAQMQLQTLKTQHVALLKTLERTKQQCVQFEKRLIEIENYLRDNDEPVSDLKSELSSLFDEKLVQEKGLSDARDKYNSLEMALKGSDKTRQACHLALDEKRQALETAKLKGQKLSVYKETLDEKLKTTGLTFEQILKTLPDTADIKAWEVALADLNHSIEKLGAINLAAIEEYADAEKRKIYLDEQDTDLQNGLSILEDAIKKIDKETRHQFKETFDRVNQGYGTLFPKIFGGGHAQLELIGEDLLNTGVAVMARPPGKRNGTIQQLSGGEKALTAIALVFAIFQLNPAPFCMLDEVDAPLDDFNVGRYCDLVKNMSEQVQFIYISHNKLAIEMATQLQGVTMREPGVSRLVTVDLEEATTLVDA